MPPLTHQAPADKGPQWLDQKASPFARVSLVAYLFLILYASWYPFTGWENDSLVTLPEALQQWPHYWTKFDAITNVIGYIPLGALIVFALYPWRHRALSVLLATLAGIATTVLVEVVQHFLPTRVTSLMDIATNSAGAFIGALIGWALIPSVLERSRLRLLKNRWLSKESSRELLLLALWPLAQIYPQAYLFGMGQILPIISATMNDWFDLDIDLANLVLNDQIITAEQYLLAETFITAFGATAALLICVSILHRHAPKARLAITLFVAAISAKSLASAILFHPEYAFVWLTPGAQGGIVLSAIMAYGLSFAPAHAQRRIAVLTLTFSLCLVNLLPNNPYFSETLQGWVQGKFLNFNGAAQFLSLLWPFLALWYLLVPPTRANEK